VLSKVVNSGSGFGAATYPKISTRSTSKPKTTIISTDKNNTTPQPRRQPKTKTQIFVKFIEDFMRDQNALIQNKGKVIEVLLKGAALIEKEDKDETDDNFLKNLQLNKKVIRRMLHLDKKLSQKLQSEITEIIHADEAVESSTDKTSKKDDGSSLSSREKKNNNIGGNEDEDGDEDDDEEEDDDAEDDMEPKTTSDDLDSDDFDADEDSDDDKNVFELKRKMETKKKSASDDAKRPAKRHRTGS
jgi:hypothetical protein